MQPNPLCSLEQIVSQRSETVRELMAVCDGFAKKIEEEKAKILSFVFPVAILLSFGRKSKPQEDPLEILKRYRFNQIGDEDSILLLSKIYDIWEYTENIKAMIVDGGVSIEDLSRLEALLSQKLEEKEDLMREIPFATSEEIEAVLNEL